MELPNVTEKHVFLIHKNAIHVPFTAEQYMPTFSWIFSVSAPQKIQRPLRQGKVKLVRHGLTPGAATGKLGNHPYAT